MIQETTRASRVLKTVTIRNTTNRGPTHLLELFEGELQAMLTKARQKAQSFIAAMALAGVRLL